MIFMPKGYRETFCLGFLFTSKALERFAPVNVPLPAYTLSPQHQLHEFKVAGIFNLHKFYFSATMYMVLRMQILREAFKSEAGNVSYNRFDVAVTYDLNPNDFPVNLVCRSLMFSIHRT